MNATNRITRAVFTAIAMLGAGLLAVLQLSAAPAGPPKAASLYSTDFSKGADAWIVTSGTFQWEGGAYRSRAVVEENKLSRAIVGEKSWQNYRVTARMKLEQAANDRADYGVMARYQDAGNYYIFLYKVHAKKFTIETKIKNKLKTVAEVPFALDDARWHDIQVTVVGDKLSLVVDGQPVAQATNAEFAAGPAGLLSFWADVQCNRFVVETVAAP